MPGGSAPAHYTETLSKWSQGSVVENKNSMQAVFAQAEELLRLCQSLDYAAVVAHQPAAVAALQNAVRDLKQALAGQGGLSIEAPTPAVAEQPAERAALLERRRHIVEALSHAGLGERLGKLYCTDAERRLVAFRDVPHRNGLPAFDMVVGPDYSPVNGYHGVFIGSQEVMSCILPFPAAEHRWQVQERKRFAAIEEVVDVVGMLSAGFPLG